MDLQLHFFWSFNLTLLGLFWEPLLLSGVVITFIKEGLDYLAEKGWSWGDFWFGILGALAAMMFIWFLKDQSAGLAQGGDLTRGIAVPAEIALDRLGSYPAVA